MYEQIDGIYCISLEGQVDRQEYIQRMFARLNIPVEMYIVKKHPKGGRVGCFTSHYDIWKMAHTRGYKNVLIFEDDALPTNGYDKEIIQETIDFALTNSDWEIIQLGYSCKLQLDPNIGQYVDCLSMIKSKHVNGHIYRYHGATTHAYMLSRRGIAKMLQYAPRELSKPSEQVEHVDLWMQTIMDPKNAYAVMPMQFDQAWCFGTTNLYTRNLEVILRNGGCYAMPFVDLYKISLISYYRILILICIILVICIIVVYITKK